MISTRTDTVLELGSEPLGRIVVEGAGCTVRIGQGVTLLADVLVHGDNALVEIGDGCHINGVIRIVRGDGGVIRIGRGTTINHAALTMHEASEILVGDDCMFATEVYLDPSDMHPIYDAATGERINPAMPIHVGDHVWLAKRVVVGKGSRIGSGSVVGAHSWVRGELPPNVIAVGEPARVVRENVHWRRDFNERVTLTPTGLEFAPT